MPSPTPVAYPLGPPTYSGNTLTVDNALQQPTRITRRIADLTLQKFIVDRIFTTGDMVKGGAVVYDQALLNELYTDRDVEYVAPGDEFPNVTTTRTSPKVAPVEKWGGKFFVTDEAKDRNDIVGFNNQTTQLANTIVRKLNARAVETLEAAIAGIASLTMAGHSWSSVVTGGASQTNNSGWPQADFANAQALADGDELGVVYDLLLVNPIQKAQLAIVYGAALPEVLKANGIDEMFASNRITAGTAYEVARGQVGGIQMEKPLGTEVYREEKTERTWVQASARPVFYVTNPYSIRKLTGLS
ncbi:MAG: hypothetical protein EPO40_03160 [Myxococcaceae bacterium]|nr:MAG: hypothetical protein EPO40_03160 [Myxococcaceae bacterium]